MSTFGVIVFRGRDVILRERLGKNKVQYCIMAFHILLTFLWADRVLKDIGEIAIGNKAMNDVVSRNFENIMAYVFPNFLPFSCCRTRC